MNKGKEYAIKRKEEKMRLIQEFLSQYTLEKEESSAFKVID
jgi:hypothetical protein